MTPIKICGILPLLAIAVFWQETALCQEADSGFDLAGTVSAASFYSHQFSEWPRDGNPVDGGFRAMLYPTWKIDSHWSVAGAIQIDSRPYFEEDFDTQGHGTSGEILQLNLTYSQFWNHASLAVHVGELSSAFGAFLPRYDDAVNPLIGIPLAYGYYYKGVSFLSLAGAEVDATAGKLDFRAQLVNSSPANRRSIFDSGQYANWAGGIGYTVRQGLRIGASSYYGPYLDRQYPYYFPGELPPRDLPAIAYGFDAEWGVGHWNVWAEWQHFQYDYHVIPTYIWNTGYTEVRRVLSPRWYTAARIGFLHSGIGGTTGNYEFVAGFRPGTHELVKVGYLIQTDPQYRGTLGNTAEIQFVASIPAISFAK